MTEKNQGHYSKDKRTFSHLPLKSGVSKEELARRAIVVKEIPSLFAKKMLPDEIAAALSLPVALVEQHIRAGGLRRLESKEVERNPIPGSVAKRIALHGERIAELRELGYTQEQISQETGLTEGEIDSVIAKLFETGATKPKKQADYHPSKRPKRPAPPVRKF